MSDLTKAIQEMERLERDATPGPWEIYRNSFDNDIGAIITTNPPRDYPTSYIDNAVVITDSGVYPPFEFDAQFIATARTFIPQAIAEIRRLETELDAEKKGNDVMFQQKVKMVERIDRLERELLEARDGYRCFHCHQVFSEALAKQHFGNNTTGLPLCIQYEQKGMGGGPHDAYVRVLKDNYSRILNVIGNCPSCTLASSKIQRRDER